jgi:hypothetical protein
MTVEQEIFSILIEREIEKRTVKEKKKCKGKE